MLKKNARLTMKQSMPYLFWLLVTSVTILLLIELKPSDDGWPHLDKLVHATLFLLLSATGYLSYTKHKASVSIGLIIFAATTEWLQSALTVTRHASLYDWVADVAGILLCVVIFVIVKQHFATKV